MTNGIQKNDGKAWIKPNTVLTIAEKRKNGDKITMLTCYDSSFAAMMNRCGVEVLLVGDSLGMVCQGQNSTLTVTLADIQYHTTCVARGNQSALLVADLPFGTYGTPHDAYNNAVLLIQAGAHMVKLEGGAWLAPTVKLLTERAIPVCVHLGLTPQSIHQLGGYKVQGKTIESAETLKSDAQVLQEAGAQMLVLEAIPSSLGKAVTDALTIPTIGIGAGLDCSGQVLVVHDMLDIFPGKKARFVRNFMEGQPTIEAAIAAFVAAVKDKSFPAIEHCF